MLVRSGTFVRRACGGAVVGLVVFPVHRVLAGRETGLAGQATVLSTDVVYAFLWAGTAVIALVALLASRITAGETTERWLRSLAGALTRPKPVPFALATGALALLLSGAFALFALDARPTHPDAISQLLHARFLAAGQFAGDIAFDPAFRHIQNSVVTEHGWVSHYPPGHVVLLAGGMMLGAVWLVGPFMVGVAAYFTARLAERLVPRRLPLARAGALLVACSPFVVCLGASFMNHAPTLAALAAATWFAVRSIDEGLFWSVAAGAGVGVAFTIRPLTALAIGVATLLAAWLPRHGARASATPVLRSIGAAAIGALPFVAAVALYNLRFFGSPVRFGYTLTLGPSSGPGFGRDPWGNVYGPVEALGYTAADLVALGGALIEAPLSPVLLVGLLLLFTARLSHGERILAAWALAPLAANAVYWHHGLYMGPRMLYEAAPAWMLLAVMAAGHAWHKAVDLRFAGRLRTGIAGAGACALAMALWLAPQRAAGYSPAPTDVSALRPPAVDGPSLVFVHDAWRARLAMQLAGAGMRLDSVETVLRQNPTCSVQELVDAFGSTDPDEVRTRLGRLDFDPRSHDLPPQAALTRGNTIRVDPDIPLTIECVRQVNADRNGILDLAPLVWLGDLPGSRVQGPLFVRDLGPEHNARLIAGMSDRRPLMLYSPADGGDPVLSEYGPGVAHLWGADAKLARVDGTLPVESP